MNKKLSVYLVVLVVVTAAVLVVTSMTAEARRGDGPVIYVVSQDLYYDSIVAADPLPPKGDFQELRQGGGPLGGDLNTDFGPGDPGYRGGRWVETFSSGEPHYFSCPLLGPGRDTP
ncbi:MAG: hypothetical protein ACYTEQ_07680 [Planctomycetota bacterium]|jgi:hypothetical protein